MSQNAQQAYFNAISCSSQNLIDCSDIGYGIILPINGNTVSLVGQYTSVQLRRIASRMDQTKTSQLANVNTSKLLWAKTVAIHPHQYKLEAVRAAYTILKEHGEEELCHDLAGEFI